MNGADGSRLADVARQLAREPMTVVVLVLGFYLAQDAGWIPSKGRQAVDLLTAHVTQAEAAAKRRDEADTELLRVLRQKARVDQAMCLAWAQNSEIRRVCLEP